MKDFKLKMKHNCCNEKNFQWSSIDPIGVIADRLICMVCGREFIDTMERYFKSDR